MLFSPFFSHLYKVQQTATKEIENEKKKSPIENAVDDDDDHNKNKNKCIFQDST